MICTTMKSHYQASKPPVRSSAVQLLTSRSKFSLSTSGQPHYCLCEHQSKQQRPTSLSAKIRSGDCNVLILSMPSMADNRPRAISLSSRQSANALDGGGVEESDRKTQLALICLHSCNSCPSLLCECHGIDFAYRSHPKAVQYSSSRWTQQLYTASTSLSH
jgi:hypothetical protein